MRSELGGLFVLRREKSMIITAVKCLHITCETCVCASVYWGGTFFMLWLVVGVSVHSNNYDNKLGIYMFRRIVGFLDSLEFPKAFLHHSREHFICTGRLFS